MDQTTEAVVNEQPIQPDVQTTTTLASDTITEQKQAAQQQQMDMMNAVQESQVAKNVAPAVQAINETDRQQ